MQSIENKFVRVLTFGLVFTTILVVAGPVSDPVNVPKLLALGALSFSLLPFLVYTGRNKLFQTNKLPTILTAFFILASINAVLFSNAPFTENFYGVPGRNIGFVTLFCFSILFLVTANLNSYKNIMLIVFGFLFAGLLNVVYGFIDHFIGDIFAWNNNYGAFLGTFGNPNFAGAFLGLIVGGSFAMFLGNLANKRIALLYFVLSGASGIVVLFTKTTQGLLVSGLTISISLGIFLHFQFQNRLISTSYFIATMTVGIFVVLGILQKGPLESFLYKRSVSLRGLYWNAAIEVGNSHPFTGVGLDAFGHWYRRARSEKAASWFGGPELVTNAAHNFYLDMYANGGIFLLLSYLSFTILGLISIKKILKASKSYDPFSVLLIGCYFGFLGQAIISISQIGIAIWGWVIIGLLYSYARVLEINNVDSKNIAKSRKIVKNVDSPVGVFMFVIACFGILIAIPPYSADAKYTNALNSQDLSKVKSALTPGYFNPRFSQTLAGATLLLERNNLFDLSHQYALEGVKFNPESFDSWKLLYYLKNSTEEERKVALKKMKELDPQNNTLEKLK